MYTGDTASTTSQGNTKSTIQALLRKRELRPLASRSLSIDSAKDKHVPNTYSKSPDSSDLKGSKNLEFDIKSQASPENAPNSANPQENLDQKDFNYSQKLFHIADGNLYSIFSPIQGRSYGMKPSFLRKQKYTIQECHSRGRKNLRKGLKFHNFLPSESVTSEKDNGFLNTKWKVHSECRLREEHGTKQITISNWSQSVQNPDEATNYSVQSNLSASSSSSSETSSKEHSVLLNNNDSETEYKPCATDPYDFNLSLQQPNPLDITDLLPKLNKIRNESVQNAPNSSTVKKDSLNLVLSSLLEKPLLSEKKYDYSSETETQNKSFQKHRRKPVQTRRIVPYVKYLSIMEENESLPLDLSSKCLIDNASNHSASSGDESQNISGKNDLDLISSSIIGDKFDDSKFVFNDSNLVLPMEQMIASQEDLMQSQMTSPVTVLYPLPFNKNPNLEQNGFNSLSIQGPGSSKMYINANQNLNNSFNIPTDKTFNSMNQSLHNNSAFSVQKSFVKEVQSKPRRRNQRSAIKQKLEDTFRQNGFLVKTKQVSDGEATFCKFRQLRKYTRYYLKSLEQHLPDEFHKMWKGFLPPKTVMPTVMATPDPTNETA